MACGALLLLAGCSGGAGSPAEDSPAVDASAAAASTTQVPAATPLSGPDAVVVDWPAEAPAERGAEQRAVAVYFEWRTDAGDFPTLMKPPGAQPEALMFVDMLRITRDCV